VPIGTAECDLSSEAFTTARGRTQMNEVMLYEVRDGRIVREQFFH